MEALQGEIILTPFRPRKNRNGPPSANQVVSGDEPRHGHAVYTLRVHPPTSPTLPFLLKQSLSPQDIAGSDKHEAEMLIGAMGPKEFINMHIATFCTVVSLMMDIHNYPASLYVLTKTMWSVL